MKDSTFERCSLFAHNFGLFLFACLSGSLLHNIIYYTTFLHLSVIPDGDTRIWCQCVYFPWPIDTRQSRVISIKFVLSLVPQNQKRGRVTRFYIRVTGASHAGFNPTDLVVRRHCSNYCATLTCTSKLDRDEMRIAHHYVSQGWKGKQNLWTFLWNHSEHSTTTWRSIYSPLYTSVLSTSPVDALL